jgi:hypothetical protein
VSPFGAVCYLTDIRFGDDPGHVDEQRRVTTLGVAPELGDVDTSIEIWSPNAGPRWRPPSIPTAPRSRNDWRV